MEPGEYESLVAKADAGNSTAAIELLTSMRVHKISQPEIVVLHGGRLLGSCPRKLGNEVWTVMEQVFLAACEIGADKWRDYCLGALEKKFPSSTRVERLKGIRLECKEDYEEAKKVYTKLLTDKPEDTVTRKRLIAMHKQRGHTNEAIDELQKYLDTFCIDAEVWHELSELYIEAGSLSRAVFCFEELVMSNPRSMYHILCYAELLYSTGDHEMSRKYFSLASYLDGNNLRALWGLWACSLALAEKDKQKEKLEELQKLTVQKLRTLYKAAGEHGKLALALLDESL
eukprot:TRINITY_DN46718_c0_g1_i1.p1 TRINITY_DN46718_c0_g1~~TRINITY_DN46718_c0_g1_i1.p1  ORF type:complete len:317 (-),score=63.72 TRINITY_DN46718_c0_g1_i1:179-1036(-)